MSSSRPTIQISDHHIWPFFINFVSAASVAFATIFGYKKRPKADWLGFHMYIFYCYTLAKGILVLVKRMLKKY